MRADLRRKAVEFYFDRPTTGTEAWIEGRSEGDDVDPDIRSLALLLEQVYRDGYDAGVRQVALPPKPQSVDALLDSEINRLHDELTSGLRLLTNLERRIK